MTAESRNQVSKHQVRISSWMRGQDGGSPCTPLFWGAGKLSYQCPPQREKHAPGVEVGLGEPSSAAGKGGTGGRGASHKNNPDHEHGGQGVDGSIPLPSTRGLGEAGQGGRGADHPHSATAHHSKPQGGKHAGLLSPPPPTGVGPGGCLLGSGMAIFSQISGKANQQQSWG